METQKNVLYFLKISIKKKQVFYKAEMDPGIMKGGYSSDIFFGGGAITKGRETLAMMAICAI